MYVWLINLFSFNAQIKVLYLITNDYGPIITKRYFCWQNH